jgi:uncharacterized membrane protein YedE/YeeE
VSVLEPLAGGMLIGLAAAGLLLFVGRVAGISGIAGGLLGAGAGDRLWRAAFLAGLLAGGALLRTTDPAAVRFGLERPLVTIVAAGLLVGYGTRLGSGCTAGHGVCGVAGGSRRSIVATMTFMAVGMLMVLLTRLARGAL